MKLRAIISQIIEQDATVCYHFLKVVDGRFPVLVDGCIESGVEAFKAFACGADGIMVCRTLMKEFPKGPEAVTARLEAIRSELAGAMANTGAKTIADINSDMVCRKTW